MRLFANFIWIPLVIGFWGIVFYQWIDKQGEKKQILKAARCPRCGKSDLYVEIFVINQKTNHKVGILKNIGGGFLLFIPGIFLLRAFVLYLIDFISGSNTTGIQSESLVGKIGVSSFPLIVGLSISISGLLLLIDFFIGKKEKVVKLTCNSCRMVYSPLKDQPQFQKINTSMKKETILTSKQILNMLKQLEIREIPYRSLDGGNYINDHTLMDGQNAVKKIELFISFGGKVTSSKNLICVAWRSHSRGELEVFRVGEDKFFVHGEIYTG